MANEQVAEWVDGATRSDIEWYAEIGRTVELGRIHSRYSTCEEDRQRFSDRMDGLLQLFDIDPTNWQETIIGGEGTVTTLLGAVGDRKYEIRDLQRWARRKKLGEFVLDKAYWAVPIESDDDQTGEFKLVLALSSVVATVKSFGQQEVDRIYIDPETHEEVQGTIEELEEKSLRDEVHTDITAVHTLINYSVGFSLPDKSS